MIKALVSGNSMQSHVSSPTLNFREIAQKICTDQVITAQDRQLLRKRLLNVFLEDAERELLEEISNQLCKGLINILD